LEVGIFLLILSAVVVVLPRLIDTNNIQDPAKRLDEVNGLRTTPAPSWARSALSTTAGFWRRRSAKIASRRSRTLEAAEPDQARFLKEAWGEDLRGFVREGLMQTVGGWCPVLPEAGGLQMVRTLYRFQPEALLPRVEVLVLIVAASDASDGVAPDMLGWWRSRAELAAALRPQGSFRRYLSRHDIPLIRPADLALDFERSAVHSTLASGPDDPGRSLSGR